MFDMLGYLRLPLWWFDVRFGIWPDDWWWFMMMWTSLIYIFLIANPSPAPYPWSPAHAWAVTNSVLAQTVSWQSATTGIPKSHDNKKESVQIIDFSICYSIFRWLQVKKHMKTSIRIRSKNNTKWNTFWSLWDSGPADCQLSTSHRDPPRMWHATFQPYLTGNCVFQSSCLEGSYVQHLGCDHMDKIKPSSRLRASMVFDGFALSNPHFPSWTRCGDGRSPLSGWSFCWITFFSNSSAMGQRAACRVRYRVLRDS